MKIKSWNFSLFIFVIVTLTGCGTGGGDESYRTISGFTQGTSYNITYQGERDYTVQIDSLLLDFDESLSFYSDSSLLSAVNGGETRTVDSTFIEVFVLSQKIYAISDGLFDPTLGALFELYKSKDKELINNNIERIRASVGLSSVTLQDAEIIKQDSSTKLDFSGIAQGMAVDKVAELLSTFGVKNSMVEIGGEILATGVSPRGKKWRIGIDLPEEGNMVSGAELSGIIEIGGVNSKDNPTIQGVATSGNYRKFIDLPNGQRITHTIDPRTKEPVTHNLLSATVVAPSAALADGLATAAMVGGVEWTKAMIESLNSAGGENLYHCYLIYADSTGAMQVYSTL